MWSRKDAGLANAHGESCEQRATAAGTSGMAHGAEAGYGLLWVVSRDALGGGPFVEDARKVVGKGVEAGSEEDSSQATREPCTGKTCVTTSAARVMDDGWMCPAFLYLFLFPFFLSRATLLP